MSSIDMSGVPAFEAFIHDERGQRPEDLPPVREQVCRECPFRRTDRVNGHVAPDPDLMLGHAVDGTPGWACHMSLAKC